MQKRRCSNCNEVKDDSEFSFQKTKPIFKYKWCDICREVANAERLPFVRNARLVREDFDKMRAKGVELRKFDPEQCKELKRRISAGEKKSVLAAEFHVSPSTLARAIRGYN